MKRIILALIFIIFIPFTVNAQTTESTDDTQAEAPANEERSTSDLFENRAKTREAALERRENLKSQFEARKEALETRRENLKKQFEARREAFKERLETIKDQRKKQITERVDQRLNNVNKNRTDHFSKVLERLNEVLTKIQTKAAELEAEGKDTTAVDSAITTASAAISTAQTAVADQAGKEYVASITTEDGLKNAVGAAFSQLQADLKSTREKVSAAKDAVKKAVVELRKVMLPDTEEPPEPVVE